MTQHLQLTRSDGVATIALKSGKVNALCAEMLHELESVAEELSRSGSRPGAVVITGGEKLFAAGAEISEFAADTSSTSFKIASYDTLVELGRAFPAALNAVAAIPVPTISSISGYALGGGCELALATDLRIGSTKAKLGQPEIALGIIPGGGGTQRLPRLVGAGVAKELIFTGRTIDADEALRIGLLNEVVEPDELDGRVEALATSLANGPTNSLILAKQAIDEGTQRRLDEGLVVEQSRFVESFATPDATIGVSSFLHDGPGKADFSSIT